MNDGFFDKKNTRATSSVRVLLELVVAVMLLQLVQHCNTHQWTAYEEWGVQKNYLLAYRYFQYYLWRFRIWTSIKRKYSNIIHLSTKKVRLKLIHTGSSGKSSKKYALECALACSYLLAFARIVQFMFWRTSLFIINSVSLLLHVCLSRSLLSHSLSIVVHGRYALYEWHQMLRDKKKICLPQNKTIAKKYYSINY